MNDGSSFVVGIVIGMIIIVLAVTIGGEVFDGSTIKKGESSFCLRGVYYNATFTPDTAKTFSRGVE